MAQIVPLISTPSQALTIILANQTCQILVSQKYGGLYLTLAVNNDTIVSGRICQNNNRLVRNSYFGFAGDLLFNNAEGTNDPDYTGLGNDGRYQLLYLTADEVAGLPGE